ncbi:hypothetical protein [Bacillus horti]|uniref:Uncharacterized protein n=1 Tax=Caldalkalibacillus horti TaxID=77523 RepID=A0ABT9VT90_9BACI|nr:hypothetical protein [Bacillus horti]MDQ0164197.1 hypothetical protein [Bacillus horti]
MVADQASGYSAEHSQNKRAIEVLQYKKKLEHFNIQLHELTTITPSCTELRAKALHFAKRLAQDPQMVEHIKDKNLIPTDKWMMIKSIYPTYASYIIALIILFSEGYTTLASFLNL